jgi:uncharacterized glyoxalase superfamily protein PhnB
MPIYPSFRYRDPRAAIAWLESAFGFVVHAVHEDDAGAIVHAELAADGALLMLGPQREDAFGDHVGHGWTYVAIDDPDARFARATAAGAEVVRPLTDEEYGSRDFSVRDPEGNLWSFGTYAPAVGAAAG